MAVLTVTVSSGRKDFYLFPPVLSHNTSIIFAGVLEVFLGFACFTNEGCIVQISCTDRPENVNLVLDVNVIK